ncbi:MFS transporter [Chryseolinea lacunae]|uniref:MFS transporter n=1 Tax=Chryseolinea lacunae TaxID=2801331 RepID=A0ABS1KT86_9BACT|nr:MFS transporter [Chryseolinea lacunae]MBL0742683.1 MFS transporter [Chryseolinea lacunae]
MKTTSEISLEAEPISVQKTVFPILFTISFTHLLNDMMQSVIPAVYPLLKDQFKLSFTEIGLITLTFQLTASLLQPFVGFYTDKKPLPFSLAIGMSFTLAGLLLLSVAGSFSVLLVSVALVGMGSSVFHPESSRVAQLASGGKKGLAQSIFQVGGNAGSALGPLLAALIVMPYGMRSVSWISVAALLGIFLLWQIGKWYANHLHLKKSKVASHHEGRPNLSKGKIIAAIGILLLLIFSKYFYMANMTSYFTFFLIDKFHITPQQSQLYLFAFLAAVAVGTILGGPLGDRFGRKVIIWFSILGVAPFTLMLPYANLFWTIVLAVIVGMIIASAFSAILVYATDLVPGKVGTIAGLFFGLAFGMGGLGSAVLGNLADHTSISFVFRVCAFLPLLGIVTGLLPDVESRHKKS